MILNKRFYDILSILFILLFVGLFVLQHFFLKNLFSGIPDITTIQQSIVITMAIRNILIYGLGLAYWLFILRLAIKMNSQNLIKVADVVVIAMFIPFAIFFYFLSLRQHFKEMK